MVTAFTSTSSDEALRGFVLHLKAVRAKKTVAYYETQVRQLSGWAQTNDIPLEKFGKRHLDAYLVSRAEAGKAQMTLHHDAMTAKVFLKWCQKNDVVDRSLLADYEVRNAPKPAMYMPTAEDMQALLAAVPAFWDPFQNPEARYSSPAKRAFHRDRNYAIILTLLDSAYRLGEVLSLKLDDYQE